MEGDGRKRNRSRKRRRSKTKTDSFSTQIQTIQSTHISPDNDRDEDTATASPPAKQHHFKCRNPKAPAISKSSSFLEKMKARLSGGHFRMINEKLYTCTGDEALGYFKDDPSLFDMYHAGYQEQMSHWPELPVNIIIRWLKDHSPSLVVADFGCGDARVAKSVKNKVFSIDLVSNEPSVIACDMANVRPFPDLCIF
ncbi:Ribosomal RNA-processing protein 8-like protein [Drosera capensis]